MDILSFLLGYSKGKAQSGESADAVLDEVDAYLDNINGGNVHLVTFVGANGKTLCAVTVPNGADCPDPIATGLISTPTKTSTTYFAYEFVGWSNYENGELNADALKNVTESRTLYAVFLEIRIRGSLGGTSYWVASDDYKTIHIYGNGDLERVEGETWGSTVGNTQVNGRAEAVVFHNENITSIGEMLFVGCHKLTSIEIPNTVTSVGKRAFALCYALANISLSNSLTSIGEGAFYLCDDFTSITIPASVTSIGDYAFDCCDRLTSATFEVTSGWTGKYTDLDTNETTTVDISASVALADTSLASEALRNTYKKYEWSRG